MVVAGSVVAVACWQDCAVAWQNFGVASGVAWGWGYQGGCAVAWHAACSGVAESRKIELGGGRKNGLSHIFVCERLYSIFPGLTFQYRVILVFCIVMLHSFKESIYIFKNVNAASISEHFLMQTLLKNVKT